MKKKDKKKKKNAFRGFTSAKGWRIILTMIKTLAEIGGWVGMVLIHGATIPTSVSVIMGWSSDLPPLDMVLLIWSDLFLFFLRALARFDWLYLVSNAVGFFLQSVLLAIILFQ